MIRNRPSLFDKEVDYLIREVIDSPTLDSKDAIGEIGMLLSEYEATIFDEFLKVSLPKNAEKFSTKDIYQGPDKVLRYLDMLEAEMNLVDSFGTSIFNQIEYQKSLLRELSNRILDKLDAATLYGGGSSASFILEMDPSKFLNETEDSGYERLTIPDGTGAVLPILTSSQIKVDTFSITENSNGKPGDPSNLDKTFNRDSLSVIFDDNPTTYFEYSRVGNEDIRLGLQFSFSSEKIFNCIDVSLVEYSFAQQADLVKLEYQLTNGQWADLIESPFSLSRGPIYLNPVKTKAIRLVLKSSGSEPIKVGNNRYSNRAILGISNIKLFSVLYKEKGQAISLKFERLAGNKVSLRDVKFLPTQEDLFEYQVFLRNEQGNWEEITTLDTDDNDFVNVLNNTLEAKLNLNIKPKVFANRSSTFKPSTFVDEYRRFDVQRQNPNSFVLTDIFNPETVGVIQENNWNIGLRKNLLERLGGTTLFDGAVFDLPSFDLHELQRLEIFVNGKLIPRVNNLGSVSTLSYALGRSDEGNSTVTFSDGEFGLDPNAIVSYRVRPEPLRFNLKGDSYVALTKRPITPARGNIKLEYLSKEILSQVQYFQPGQQVYKLAQEMIYGEVGLQEKIEDLLVQSSRTEVFATSDLPFKAFTTVNQFYIDRINGILYFSEELENEMIVNYRYKKIKKSNDYSIRTNSNNKNEPIGIIIPANKASVFTAEDIIGMTREAKHDFQTDSVPQYFSSQIEIKDGKKIYLSHGEIVEGSVVFKDNMFPNRTTQEVPYVDGRTELSVGDFVYLPLNKTLTNVETTWSFNIPEDLNIDTSLGFFPKPNSVFVTQLSEEPSLPVPGDWWVDVHGTNKTIYVRVSAGTELNGYEANAMVGMFLTTKRDDKVYYSVDYNQGLIFCSEEPANNSKVQYSVMPYRISYIPAESKEFEIDGESIKIDPSILSSNDVYVFFRRTQIEQNIEELKQYYSPVLKSLEFISN